MDTKLYYERLLYYICVSKAAPRLKGDFLLAISPFSHPSPPPVCIVPMCFVMGYTS